MAIIIIGLLGIGGYWYFRFRYLDPYRRIFQPEALSKNFQFNTVHTYEEVYLPSEGSIQIHALHLKIGFPKGVVLYFHGNEGNIETCLPIADDFLIKGYNLFIVDYRGFGKSGGAIKNPESLYYDADLAYKYLLNLYKEENIIVYGRSIGSPIATYIASKYSPQSLVLECPFISLKDIAQYYYLSVIYKTLIRFDYSTEKWVKDVKCPIYFFHSVSDRIVSIDCSKKLAEMANAKTFLTKIQSSSHYTLRNYLEYQMQLEKILHPTTAYDKKQYDQKPPLVIKPIFKKIMNS